MRIVACPSKLKTAYKGAPSHKKAEPALARLRTVNSRRGTRYALSCSLLRRFNGLKERS